MGFVTRGLRRTQHPLAQIGGRISSPGVRCPVPAAPCPAHVPPRQRRHNSLKTATPWGGLVHPSAPGPPQESCSNAVHGGRVSKLKLNGLNFGLMFNVSAPAQLMLMEPPTKHDQAHKIGIFSITPPPPEGCLGYCTCAQAPPCVTFRLVFAPSRGPGRSPILPFACCVESLLSVGRCGRCSCWCRFHVRGAQ